jgi:hypothetical protein
MSLVSFQTSRYLTSGTKSEGAWLEPCRKRCAGGASLLPQAVFEVRIAGECGHGLYSGASSPSPLCRRDRMTGSHAPSLFRAEGEFLARRGSSPHRLSRWMNEWRRNSQLGCGEASHSQNDPEFPTSRSLANDTSEASLRRRNGQIQRLEPLRRWTHTSRYQLLAHRRVTAFIHSPDDSYAR